MSDDLVNLASLIERRQVNEPRRAAIVVRKAATALEEARAEIEAANYAHARMRDRAHAAESELSTLRDMLVLCGELGGMGKDETPAAYLRRLIDEVANVESLRARVREVVGPFVSHYAPWMDKHDPETQSSTFPRHTFAQLNAARQLMEEVK